MAWFRVQLTEQEQRVVNEERCCHPNLRSREKMLVLWLLHTGLTREQAAKTVGVSRATVQRYVAAFRQRGLDGPRHFTVHLFRPWMPNSRRCHHFLSSLGAFPAA